MTASQFVQPDQRTTPGGAAAAIAIAIVATVAVLGLFTAGVTFLGLAIAFPLVGTLVDQYHLVVKASDLVLAENLAGFWWVFGALSIASVIAAAVVAIKAIQYLSPTPRD